jgi:hypothetical protein
MQTMIFRNSQPFPYLGDVLYFFLDAAMASKWDRRNQAQSAFIWGEVDQRWCFMCEKADIEAIQGHSTIADGMIM